MIDDVQRSTWRALPRRLRDAVDLVCPHYCLVCRRRDPGGQPMALCRCCRSEILALAYASCQRCGARSRAWGLPCGDCQDRPFSFRRVLPLGSYEGRLRQAILASKRFGNAPLCYCLAQLLATHPQLADDAPPYDLILPAPMHWKRRLERGFQGTAVMATALARQIGIPVETRLLCQRRATNKQGTLLDRERRGNVRGAFRLRRPSAVVGQRILLLDDVMTSGATAEELSRLLISSGACAVDVLVAARSVPARELPAPCR